MVSARRLCNGTTAPPPRSIWVRWLAMAKTSDAAVSNTVSKNQPARHPSGSPVKIWPTHTLKSPTPEPPPAISFRR